MTRSTPLAVAIILLAGLVQVAPPTLAQDADGRFAVSGVVVSDAGEPIAGATVTGWTRGEDSVGRYGATTAEDGSFTLHLPAGKGAVEVWYEKWSARTFQDVLVEGDVSDLRLVLPTPPPKDAVVEGVVRGPDGQPIPGATVTIGQGCCYAMPEPASTPPSEPEPVPVEDAQSGGGSSGSAGSAGGAATMEANATEAKAEPAMTRPIWHDGDWQETKTDEAGRYRFETYAGPRQVTAHAKGHAQESVTVQAESGRTVTADLALPRVPAKDAVLTGRVVDAATGLPVEGAQVSANNVAWSHYAWARTGADGAFRVETRPGWTHVTVAVHSWGLVDPVPMDADAAVSSKMAPARAEYYPYAKALALQLGDNALDVRLDPKEAPTIAVVGYVVDPETQTGVPNAQVSVSNQDTGDWGSATTDAAGSFRLLVRPGHHQVHVWADGHLPGLATFVVDEGETAKRVDVEAPKGQQRWAPCEEDCDSPVLYAEKGEGVAVSQDASRSGAAPTAPAPGGATTTALAESDGAAGDGGTRAASYAGSGGGLPPYDPANKDATYVGAAQTDSGAQAGASPVPAAPLALGVLALAALALVLRRR